MPAVADLAALARELRAFAAARDWDRHHNPKNLAMALIVEAAELVEHFQWREPADCRRLDAATREAVGEEMADILIYLTRMADVMGIDLLDAAGRKMERNAVKYPPRKPSREH